MPDDEQTKIEIPKPPDIQKRMDALQVELGHLKKLLRLSKEVWSDASPSNDEKTHEEAAALQ